MKAVEGDRACIASVGNGSVGNTKQHTPHEQRGSIGGKLATLIGPRASKQQKATLCNEAQARHMGALVAQGKVPRHYWFDMLQMC
mmetsp:Transcript_12516/g.25488  ORF Transcript_12516/g.25488 Transcript_12516/m.25488 type:complete len:85 (-) Transcript_12516:81-335(-)